MKHVKLFENFVDEELKRTSEYYDRPKELEDEGIKSLLNFFTQEMSNSPITFELGDSSNGFSIKGPFGLYAYVKLKPMKPGIPAQYFFHIGKFELSFADPIRLMKKIKQSLEYKLFIKGAKVEKLREAVLKKILKKQYSQMALIEYIYYDEPTIVDLKKDNSGPWATSGSSTREYNFDLTPLVTAWGPEVLDDVIKHRDEIVKKRGYRGGGISSNTDRVYKVNGNILNIVVDNHTYYN